MAYPVAITFESDPSIAIEIIEGETILLQSYADAPIIRSANGGAGIETIAVPFTIPSRPWIVNHNLNYVPQIVVTDLTGKRIWVEETITSTQIIVDPSQPMTGYIYYK